MSHRFRSLQLVVLLGSLRTWNLAEKVCHWGQALRIYSFTQIPALLSASCVRLRCDPSASCPDPPAVMLLLLSWTPSLEQKVGLVMVFITAIKMNEHSHT